jgi:hypothetical protein
MVSFPKTEGLIVAEVVNVCVPVLFQLLSVSLQYHLKPTTAPTVLFKVFVTFDHADNPLIAVLVSLTQGPVLFVLKM